jgi:hypothetical protein
MSHYTVDHPSGPVAYGYSSDEQQYFLELKHGTDEAEEFTNRTKILELIDVLEIEIPNLHLTKLVFDLPF